MLTADWRKSSKCGIGSCVHVKMEGNSIFIKDDKSPGIVIVTDPDSWQAFVEGAKAGEFDIKA